MKNKLRLLTLAILFHATSSFAIPMLSADGGTLTGVDVGGTLYDVMFGDGVAGDVYADVIFDAAHASEADAVSAAIIIALNAIGGIVSTDILGCKTGYRCGLINPEITKIYQGRSLFVDSFYATWTAPYFHHPAYWTQYRGSETVFATTSTGSVNSTYVTYSRASTAIPAPATLTLFTLGLASLGINRKKRTLDFPDFARHFKELKCNSNRGVYEQRQALYRRV
jgi:hypothetical protein